MIVSSKDGKLVCFNNSIMMHYQADPVALKDFLRLHIKQQAATSSFAWLQQQAEKLTDSFNTKTLFMAFGMASRFFSKENLNLSSEAIRQAGQLRKGFQPAQWQLLQTVRTYLLLQVPMSDKTQLVSLLDKLFQTADMDEQVALYAALPLLPHPQALVPRATEGFRTNITAVFDAIALHNPFPADFLDEKAWNQMVLKAVFMQRPLYKIDGADARANEELARILIDFTHERRAAHRQVMPELWRFVAPFINAHYFADIEKEVQEGLPLAREGALLACAQSQYPHAQNLLKQHPEVQQRIEAGSLNWQYIGQQYMAS